MYGKGRKMADNNDKDVRELLKLKQGLINENDSEIRETGYDVRMAQTASEKTKNFLWYHKAMIAGGIVLIILAVIIYLVFFVKKKPDITIYSVGNYAMSVRTNFENTMAQYTPDFDGNGERNVTIEQAVPDEFLGDTELFNEIQNGSSQIFIGPEDEMKSVYESFTSVSGEPLFAGLSEITGESGYMTDIRNTAYGKRMQLFSTAIYIAVRRTDDESQEHAMEFVKNLQDGVFFQQND